MKTIIVVKIATMSKNHEVMHRLIVKAMMIEPKTIMGAAERDEEID